MDYRSIFKCRLCGETYESGCTGSKKNIALRAVVFACDEKYSLTEPHICTNGDIGVADFQGFRKVEDT